MFFLLPTLQAKDITLILKKRETTALKYCMKQKAQKGIAGGYIQTKFEWANQESRSVYRRVFSVYQKKNDYYLKYGHFDGENISIDEKWEYKLIKALLAKGAKINQADELGYTALMWASYEGHIEVTRFLLEQGANVNARSFAGTTALMNSANFGKAAMIKLLLQHGAKIKLKDYRGFTAMDYTLGVHGIGIQLLKQAAAKKP